MQTGCYKMRTIKIRTTELGTYFYGRPCTIGDDNVKVNLKDDKELPYYILKCDVLP